MGSKMIYAVHQLTLHGYTLATPNNMDQLKGCSSDSIVCVCFFFVATMLSMELQKEEATQHTSGTGRKANTTTLLDLPEGKWEIWGSSSP